MKPAKKANLWICASLLFLAAGSGAETLRVTSWNLGLDPNADNAAAVVNQAAPTLRNLAPDVILLQQVQDWRMCQQLADALQPLQYNVLICSAFQSASPLLPAKPQVAILARTSAYFAWSQSWPSSDPQGLAGGVVFASIQAGSQRLGFFSALLADPATGRNCVQRLLAEMTDIGQWETNQVQTFVVGASCDPFSPRWDRLLAKTSAAFENVGLVDAMETIPREAKVTLRPQADQSASLADRLFAGPSGFPSNTRIAVSTVSTHYPVTCDLELDPNKVATALDIRAEERRQLQAETALSRRRLAYWTSASASLALLLWVWLRVRAHKRAALDPSKNRLPVRILPKEAPSPLRPVIFTQAPLKPTVSKEIALPKRPRPVLRLQSSTRNPQPGTPPNPAAESPPRIDPPQPGGRMSKPLDPVDQQEIQLSNEPIQAKDEDNPLHRGLIRELSAWLKHKLVRKLVADRSQLLEAQRMATHMATTLDDRLARIEAQIQNQNQAYIRRIEELNQELAAAREENRELIRERIAQVKAEMEAARVRVLTEANLDSNSFRL